MVIYHYYLISIGNMLIMTTEYKEYKCNLIYKYKVWFTCLLNFLMNEYKY